MNFVLDDIKTSYLSTKILRRCFLHFISLQRSIIWYIFVVVVYIISFCLKLSITTNILSCIFLPSLKPCKLFNTHSDSYLDVYSIYCTCHTTMHQQLSNSFLLYIQLIIRINYIYFFIHDFLKTKIILWLLAWIICSSNYLFTDLQCSYKTFP